MSDPVAVCIAQRLAKDIAFLANQGVVPAEEARHMRAQLDSLVGPEYAQLSASGPPVHPGPHPQSAYAPGLVPVPRLPPAGGYQGTPLGSGVVPSDYTPPAVDEAASDPEELATALYDYKPTAEDELPFAKGDTIVVSAHTTEDWYSGHVQGRIGPDRLFPANYVEIRPAGQVKGVVGKSYSSNSTSYGTAASSPAYPPRGYSVYPAVQSEHDEEATGTDKKDKWNKFKKSNVGQAAAGGAAFGTWKAAETASVTQVLKPVVGWGVQTGVGMGLASAIF